MRRRPFLTLPRGPDDFLWATGIEDTFIKDPHPVTGRTLEEYELTQHYERWRQDLALVASLGVPAARYGIPWYRVNPAPGQWDWSFPDAVLPALVDEGVEPIVDLVHYGTPLWLSRSFLEPDYPQRVAEYAAAFAERYRDLVRWYTPLNEPRVNAWYGGRIGFWPPYGRGWRAFVAVMLQICRGIVRTERALRDVLSDVVLVHVDATDLYETRDPALVDEARRRQEIVFLALDLVLGRVDDGHPLRWWLATQGVTDDDLRWFLERPCAPHLIGINEYPLFSLKRLYRDPQGTLRIRMPYSSAEVLAVLAEMYARRYGVPIMVTETATSGSVARRARWMESSIAAVADLRRRGVPVVGYTWWPMFALVTWAYRSGSKPLSAYLLQMGLWDLQPEPDGGLVRVATPLVERYRGHVRGGMAPLASPSHATSAAREEQGTADELAPRERR